MTKTAILVLADGATYEGYAFGAETDAAGEAVFNTSMAGYQEMLTDPSYAGQILIPTYPMIGNYGTNDIDDESRRIQVRGFVVREACELPNHYQKVKSLDEYLKASKIPGLWGVDTRAITRHLRSSGVMMGMITSSKTPAHALEALRKAPNYGEIDFVKEVTTDKPYEWGNKETAKYRVVALDCGLKYNILRCLEQQGCHITVVPCTTPADKILEMHPDGIMLSPGPGDPDLPKVNYAVETVKQLAGKQPIMGICFGNQLINRAFGGKHYKLKFGHRGGNHPVRELATGRIHITAQNHGYAADPSTIGKELEVTHINLNDGTVEGLRHKELPIFSIQYHSEASPGPLDNMYLFKQFTDMMEQENKKSKKAGNR
jgi:carbamoyl-phosphate synthase small subunit